MIVVVAFVLNAGMAFQTFQHSCSTTTDFKLVHILVVAIVNRIGASIRVGIDDLSYLCVDC